ncbi:FtsH protease activity modulator HflK [Paracoccus sp. Z118]|uniref:FtsH protease activity modulator HflK n=1 Tax=Paracoccus sp. Z118 TaxID=2851017 RepID=UPI001C2B8A9A|nr:FtsH protease activity modulator HflK [Paracoccus sp. Z118]MBV0892416.1 FtsH protease activity modulator HflK [Paracoccus sp. Z118]
MASQGPWGGGSGGNGNGPDDNNGNDGREDDKRGEPPRNPPPQGAPRPWGQPGGQQPQRPGAPRPGQGGDIDNLMRKGQDRLRVLMGGKGQPGGNGGGQGPRRPGGGGPNLSLNRGSWGIFALGAVALWVFASFYTVNTEEKSVELLFGTPYQVGDEGLNFAPWPFVTKQIVPVTGERVTEIGVGRDPMDSGLMLTRDQNIVNMQYQVVWNISDPEKYLFNLADPEGTIRAVSESAMRDIVARSTLAPILNRDRGMIAAEAGQLIQATLDSYDAGINVVRVNLDRADPPQEVIDSFREVQAAQQERDRLQNEADAYANRVLAAARGESAALVEQAEAYRAEAVNNAEGEAARFNSIYTEYAKAPDVTRKRMYLETMERVLGRVDKVILDGVQGENGSGVVPYLPLDQLRRPATDAPAATNTTTGAGPAAANAGIGGN